MEDGKYKVIEEIHVYSCFHGQIRMGVGTIFEISNCGKTARSGNVLFSPELLKYCEGKIKKIK